MYDTMAKFQFFSMYSSITHSFILRLSTSYNQLNLLINTVLLYYTDRCTFYVIHIYLDVAGLLYQNRCTHYNNVIKGAMSSQITSLTIVYSTGYSGADQWKHQSSASLVFRRRIHRWPVNSPYKWPVTRKTVPFHDVIMIQALTAIMLIWSNILYWSTDIFSANSIMLKNCQQYDSFFSSDE